MVVHKGFEFAGLSELARLVKCMFEFLWCCQRPDGITAAPVWVKNTLGSKVGRILHHDLRGYGLFCPAEAGGLEQFGQNVRVAGTLADAFDSVWDQMIEPKPRSQLCLAAAVDDHRAPGFKDPREFIADLLVGRPVILRIIRHMMQYLVDHDGVNASAFYR